MEFTSEQRERYARHFVLKEIGPEGQEKLARARVLVIGAGGLGSPAALYLAGAGVGHIGIADADRVELSNLHRQILHSAKDLGRRKVDSARERLEALNPEVSVTAFSDYVDADTIPGLIADYDFVLDCTDNYPTKFLINDACVAAGKPFVYAGVLRLQGQMLTVIPRESPCLRCVFKRLPPRGAIPGCAETGLIGAVPGVMGALQALEAVKYLVGAGELLTGRLLIFDGLSMTFQTVSLAGRRPDCEACGEAAGC